MSLMSLLGRLRSLAGFAVAPALVVLVLTAQTASASSHYVRAGASGNGSGTDWTNACTDFTGACGVASLVRGDTYYVATGRYGSRVFNTAEQGSLVITVKGATAIEHGTDTGWTNSFGVDIAQASFQFDSASNWGVLIETSYFTFDGNVGGGGVAASYGFRIEQPASCATPQNQYLFVGKIDQSQTTTNVTVKHVAVVACGSAPDVVQIPFAIGCAQCYVTNSTFANNFSGNGQKAFQVMNLANSVIEYNWTQNQWSSPANHGETISINNCHNSDFNGCSVAFPQGFGSYNSSIRYNVFMNCRGTACIAALDPGNRVAINAWKIYGNVFVDSQAGNGVIATGTSGSIVIKDTLISNNTFVDSASQIFWQCGDPTACQSATGNAFKNNLLYNSSSIVEQDSGGPIDRGYNSYISPKDTPVGEAGGQTGNFNPFINYAGLDYRLANGTNLSSGVSLPAPYNVDMLGNVRGSDGQWDRGAFEFSGSGGTTVLGPASPQNVRIIQ